MKLKSIMYALGYGKSREQLVRSEGSRRVRQAEKLLITRSLYVHKDRKQGRTETFKYMFGTRGLE